MTDAGRQRLAEALLSVGRAFFELGAAVERLSEPDAQSIATVIEMMPKMEKDVCGVPIARRAAAFGAAPVSKENVW